MCKQLFFPFAWKTYIPAIRLPGNSGKGKLIQIPRKRGLLSLFVQ
jgi:hypothetical protein